MASFAVSLMLLALFRFCSGGGGSVCVYVHARACLPICYLYVIWPTDRFETETGSVQISSRCRTLNCRRRRTRRYAMTRQQSGQERETGILLLFTVVIYSSAVPGQWPKVTQPNRTHHLYSAAMKFNLGPQRPLRRPNFLLSPCQSPTAFSLFPKLPGKASEKSLTA